MKCSKDQWTEMLSKFGASHVFATLKRLAPRSTAFDVEKLWEGQE